MPNARTPKIPSYRLHKPTGLAVVRLNGRDFYLGKHSTPESRSEYERLIAEWLSNHRQLPGGARKVDIEGASLTINELFLAYWRFAERYYRKNGRMTDECYGIKAAMRPLKRLYGRQRAPDFGPLALKTVRQAMIDSGHSRVYINDNVNRIKRMLSWGVAEELVPPSVHHGLQAVRGLKRGRSAARETEPVKPVPAEYVDAVRPFVSRQVWAMIELQQITGMRSGEVVIMRACDIDTVGDVWLYRPPIHKTEHHDHERVIELGPRSQATIQPFLKRGLGAYLFSPAEAVAEHRAR